MALYELRRISDNAVVNLIEWDGVDTYTPPSGTALIAVTASSSDFTSSISNSENLQSGQFFGSFLGEISGSISGSLTGSVSGSRVISDYVQIQNALIVSGALNITGSFILNGTSYTANTSGTSGTSGTAGTSGTPGSSGTSGTAGSSGTAGTSGTSGSSGSSGTAGTSGTSGSSGTAGTSGTPGSSGSSGTAGTSGTPGSSGSSGTAGSSGTRGTSGTSGTAGSSGTAGTSGTPGSSGTSGIGITGSSGTSGTSGTGFSTISTTGNDRILTSDGSSNAAVAESNLLFNGSLLNVTGSIQMSNPGEILNPVLVGTDEKMTTLTVTGNASGGILTFNLNNGPIFKLTLDGNVSEFTTSNDPGSGTAASFTVIMIGDGNPRSGAWNAKFYWPGGAPALPSTLGNSSVFTFVTFDQGSSYLGLVVVDNVAGGLG